MTAGAYQTETRFL